jgi:hypothetical protein
MKLSSIAQSQDNGVFKDADGGIPQGRSFNPLVRAAENKKVNPRIQVKQCVHHCCKNVMSLWTGCARMPPTRIEALWRMSLVGTNIIFYICKFCSRLLRNLMCVGIINSLIYVVFFLVQCKIWGTMQAFLCSEEGRRFARPVCYDKFVYLQPCYSWHKRTLPRIGCLECTFAHVEIEERWNIKHWIVWYFRWEASYIATPFGPVQSVFAIAAIGCQKLSSYRSSLYPQWHLWKGSI